MFRGTSWFGLGLLFALIAIKSGLDLRGFGTQVKSTFTKEGIFPYVYPVIPKDLLWIEYEGKYAVRLGNELKTSQVQNKPFVHYEAEDFNYYTLSMIDPDAFSRKNSNISQVNHWLVGNIPGNDVMGGEILTEYLGSAPSAGTGLHRYIFFLFKQPDMLLFDEIQIKDESDLPLRFNFDLKKFADKYDLGDPIAGNFYYSQFESRVPSSESKRYQVRTSSC